MKLEFSRQIFEKQSYIKIFEKQLYIKMFEKQSYINIFEKQPYIKMFEKQSYIKMFEKQSYIKMFEKQSYIKIHKDLSNGSRIVPCGRIDGQTWRSYDSFLFVTYCVTFRISDQKCWWLETFSYTTHLLIKFLCFIMVIRNFNFLQLWFKQYSLFLSKYFICFFLLCLCSCLFCLVFLVIIFL